MKKFIVFIFCLFFSINVLAYDITDNIYGIDYSNSNVKIRERNDSNKWGVNKHWDINSNNLSNVLSTPLVDSSKKVYDFADILSDEEEEEIYSKISDFIEKSNMDMVIVSVDMPYTDDYKNEMFAADFYDYNDFGIDFSNYSGILLLRNNYSRDKYYDMYIFGDAQLYFDQSRYDDILDGIYSHFTSSNYVDGMSKFISRCSSYYDNGYAYKYRNAYDDSDGYIQYNYHVPVFMCLVGSSIITLITMCVLVRKNKMIRKATSAGEYLVKDSINYREHTDQFINSHTTHYTVSSSSGGGSHGGSSGGGHSSGGGRHG